MFFNKINNKELTLPAPPKPAHIPADSKWLSGEGCGSWFSIDKDEKGFKISRFDAKGKCECEGYFEENSKNSFEINNTYEFTYLSHCNEVNIFQNNTIHKFILKQRACRRT